MSHIFRVSIKLGFISSIIFNDSHATGEGEMFTKRLISIKKHPRCLFVFLALLNSISCQLIGNGVQATIPPPPSKTTLSTPQSIPSPATTSELYLPLMPSSSKTTNPTIVDQYLCLPDNPPETARVSEVVDGDTIHVVIQGKEYKLRYIGINAPENTIEKEPFGHEAAERNRQLVNSKIVTLVKDVSETDRFGRLLRYVFVESIFVNLTLVQEGFARVKSYPPDVSCNQVLAKAEQDARISGMGLWALPTVTALPAIQTHTASLSGACDPAYPDVCIPPPPPDLDCTNISFRKFKVLAPDPHHFDMDGNGIGCEEP